MSLTGVPCLSEPSQGFVIDTACDESNPLYRRLRSLENSDDQPQDDPAMVEEVSKKISLASALSESSACPVASAKNGVSTEPPPNAFNGIAKKMTPLTREGGLLKLVTVCGIKDPVSGQPITVSEDDYVTFNYSGWLDGRTEPFTSSYFERKPIERQIGGVGPVFIGLDLALLSMEKGEIAFFLTCPEFSYGKLGTPEEPTKGGKWPEISGKEWLLWKIEVANVISAANHVTDIFGLTPDGRIQLPYSQILAAVDGQLQLGRDAFKTRRYSQAKKSFERAAKLLVEPRMLPEHEAIEKKKLLSKVRLFYPNMTSQNSNISQ